MEEKTNTFPNELILWYAERKRDLPWRRTADPYRIWLSEIMLQQTRVDQGLPYYIDFIEKFPTVFDLAKAEEDEVLKLWQGLGYYSRARNLHFTAKHVVKELNGKFPDNYKDLLKLKGVGDYTASAIASICHGEPVAVLDGNVFRVLSRYFGIDVPIHSTEGKKTFKELAEKLLDKTRPGDFNQAIMEFGAVQCKPKNPLCETCPVVSGCVAFQNALVEKFPVITKKTKVRTRHFNYLVFVSKNNETILRKREGNGIWRGLYEFPLIETKPGVNPDNFLSYLQSNIATANEPPTLYNEKPIKHLLSHQKLLVRFWVVRCKKLPREYLKKPGLAVGIPKIEDFPVPRLVEGFVEGFVEAKKQE